MADNLRAIMPQYAGTVEKIGYSESWGNYVWVQNILGQYNLYANLSDELGVAEGDTVGTDTVIGAAGDDLYTETRADMNDATTIINQNVYSSAYAEATGNAEANNLFFGISKTGFIRAALIIVAVIIIFLSVKKIITG